MLCELAIQDFVLIDRLTLAMGSGLTAMTGETGAGKSILLDSLSLAIGGKADRGLVRHGKQKGLVAATFSVPATHAAWALIAEGGLSTDDDIITLRRVQMADGKSRAFINDQSCSVALLRRVGGALIEIHGQHQSMGFLDKATHLSVLDQFANLSREAAQLRLAWQDVCTARKALAALQAKQADASREADYLCHVDEELECLAPQLGEEAQLAERRALLMAAERVAADLQDAIDVLEEDSATRRLSISAGQIDKAADRLPKAKAAPLVEAALRLDAALLEFAEARQAIINAAEIFAQNPDELNTVEERLFALRAAGRKFSRSPDALCAYKDEVRELLDGIGQQSTSFINAQEAVRAAENTFMTLAMGVSEKRKRAAKRLCAAVKKELRPLKMSGAVFCVQVDADIAPSTHGIDAVQFMISTNPGAPLAPLGGIASGGELTRLVLALKAVLAAKDGKAVIVFDEVDAGVGGAVADAVGERLARIADHAQVLVVTHSPQVAARAGVHWNVSKTGKRQKITQVHALDTRERVEEIARMLSGAAITDAARIAAQALLGGEKKLKISSPMRRKTSAKLACCAKRAA